MNADSPDSKTLPERDRKLMAEITESATKPKWKHVLLVGSTALLLVLFGAGTFSIPFVIRAGGLRLCERHGSEWFPVTRQFEFSLLEQTLRSVGILFFLLALFAVGWGWMQRRRNRQVHDLLSRLCDDRAAQ